MLNWVWTFLVITLVAALFGFTELAEETTSIA